MKSISQVLVLASTLLVGSCTANISPLGIWLSSDDTAECSTRYRAKSLGGSVIVMQETDNSAEGDDDCRRRRLAAAIGNVSPWPKDGAELTKNGNLDHFRERTDLADVDCFIFHHTRANGETQTIEACESNGVVITHDKKIAEIQMGGFDIGTYTWYVRDAIGGTSDPQTFTVVKDDGREIRRNSESVSASDVVSEAEYTEEGPIMGAAGRIYFASPGSDFADFACSGTAIYDNKSGRSLILTAAHCVWDDIDENFGSNVIFIPNRDAIQDTLVGNETAVDIHRQCSEDICGCWNISAGVVHDLWKDTPWPARLEYDYGFYVVDDVGHHEGASCGSDALDEAIDELEFEVGIDLTDELVYGLGYSLEHNPDFRYCADNTGFKDAAEGVPTYWLPNCGLTGGASGGPWMANGKIVSVNSWSYTDVPGNGGPVIDESGARCLINAARTLDMDAVYAEEPGEQGIFVNCYDRPCIPRSEAEDVDTRRLRGDGRVLCED